MKKRNKIWFLTVILVIVAMFVGLSTGCQAKIASVAETSAKDTSEVKETKIITMSGEELEKIIKESMQLGAELAIAEAKKEASTTETSAENVSEAKETVAVETTKESTVKDVKVYPYIVEEENGVPKNGNSLTISVGFNDLGFTTLGPFELFGMKFSGGQDSEGKDIGNMAILLGTAGQKTNYTLNSVDNGNAYWKVVRYKTTPIQADIDKLMNQGVIDFNKEGNGTSGDGVDKGYIVIANQEGILKTIYFEVENGVIKLMQEVKL